MKNNDLRGVENIWDNPCKHASLPPGESSQAVAREGDEEEPRWPQIEEVDLGVKGEETAKVWV